MYLNTLIMINPFENIHKKNNEVSLQQASFTNTQKIVVKKKKAGRPRKPNMDVFQIRMDKSLHAKLNRYALKRGGPSAVIADAVTRLLEDHHYQGA